MLFLPGQDQGDAPVAYCGIDIVNISFMIGRFKRLNTPTDNLLHDSHARLYK